LADGTITFFSASTGALEGGTITFFSTGTGVGSTLLAVVVTVATVAGVITVAPHVAQGGLLNWKLLVSESPAVGMPDSAAWTGKLFRSRRAGGFIFIPTMHNTSVVCGDGVVRAFSPKTRTRSASETASSPLCTAAMRRSSPASPSVGSMKCRGAGTKAACLIASCRHFSSFFCSLAGSRARVMSPLLRANSSSSAR
jgi:hypothetical protein